jgi:hypothetical protein
MSTAAIRGMSKALQKRLEDAFNSDQHVTPKPSVVLTDPATNSDGDASQVSLWLYQVSVDEFTRNATASIAEVANGRRMRFQLPPLGVNLSYLITPMGNHESAQSVLACVMLALHEEPVLHAIDAGSEVKEHARVSLQTDSLDDRIRLWESLGKPHRLSVACLVRTVRLFSKRIDPAAPIVSTTMGLGDNGGPETGE